MSFPHLARWRGPGLALALLCLGGVALRAQAKPHESASPRWEYLGEKHGVRIYSKELPGRELPVFRVEGLVDEPFWKVIRVLQDAARHPDWVPNCAESRVLSKESFGKYRIYQRFDVPWPVWDRDVVLDVHGLQQGEREVALVDIRAVESSQPSLPKRVVRIPRLHSKYRVYGRGPSQTFISYDVDAHLGGSLPTWLLRWVVRDLPVDTIQALRKQLKRVQVSAAKPS